MMAEREGFEPSVRFYPYNRLAGGCLQPTRPPLRSIGDIPKGDMPTGDSPDLIVEKPRSVPAHRSVPPQRWGVSPPHLAGGGGFEPTEACASAVFKTAAFSRSAIPPPSSTYSNSLLRVPSKTGGKLENPRGGGTRKKCRRAVPDEERIVFHEV